jgi:PST family polysaccharide transporter
MSPVSASLAERAAVAAQWRLASVLLGALARLIIGVLLSRILTPTDFGIMALALVVQGFAQPLGDLGMANALVQRADLTERHVRAAFTVSTLLGMLIAATLTLTAPLGAIVLKDVRVTPVIRLLSTGFVVQGVGVAANGLLRRRLNFRRLFFIETTSYILGYGVVGVALAIAGARVWSLVWGGLVQTSLTAVSELLAVRHAIRPLFARRECRELLLFGIGSGASSWVNQLALNADNLVVGRMLGAASLGLYARAYTLMNLPYTYAASVMSSVLFPAFAEAQGEPARLQRAYLLMTEITALVSASAMGTLAIAAPHLVGTVYGPRWLGVVLPLQILCAVGYFRALFHVGGIVNQSMGLVYSELWRQMVYAALVIAGAYFGSWYGLAGVALGVDVAILFMFFATGQLALRATGLGWRRYARTQVGALVIAVVACTSALAVRTLLEKYGAPSGVIAAGALAAAGVPWTLGTLWKLGVPELRPIKERMPGWCIQLVDVLRNRASRLQ